MAPANLGGMPNFFMMDIVNDPVPATFAVAAPEKEPKIKLATTGICGMKVLFLLKRRVHPLTMVSRDPNPRMIPAYIRNMATHVDTVSMTIP